MKKILFVILSVMLVFGIASCANESTQTDNTSDAQPEETAEPASVETEAPTDETAVSEDTSQPSSNILVVYFSATGSTKAVAQEIAQKTGGDIFEIVPAQPYTSDDLNYNDENSRVVREHNDESLQDVALESSEVLGWEGYDTVFIGYPIWWGNSSWIVDSFVKANDFSGKTVIPFATSASSDLGNSGNSLANLAGTGDWQEGKRFSSSASADEIDGWLDEIGY